MDGSVPEEPEGKKFVHKFEGTVEVVGDFLHCESMLDGKVVSRIDVNFVDQNYGTVPGGMAIYNLNNELKLRLQELFRSYYKDQFKTDTRLSKG